ncbi:NAD-dependent epimerase/dehydratase family protein [Paraneptunicella aestuarii]|uniref:NAD-dependent epimerase/dehydratase family protein n=1 Tax=Paraneptunicella aestuarii TaxID=2831148 RepID=UPI001E45A998|nr:NAD-dependent epimerase/dehydratase family protein [Paraneptunicella aestuarii]UAA37660.1 NAD-dependent epimerase/dehydratase family protein [Paraneptunicella aestuarii]
MSTVITDISSLVGFHLCKRLLAKGENVIGVYSGENASGSESNRSNKSSYRINALRNSANAHHLQLHELDLLQTSPIEAVLAQHQPATVIHLSEFSNSIHNAQQVLCKTMNVLHACHQNQIQHCILNSSSDVYLPHLHNSMSVHELAEHPHSIVGATARSNELFAHSISHTHQLPCTIVRLFEVYGEEADSSNLVQRFWDLIQRGEDVNISTYLGVEFDFTYVDDVCNTLLRLMEHPAKPDPEWLPDDEHLNSSDAPWRIYNSGTGVGTDVLGLVELLEVVLEKKASIKASSEVQTVKTEIPFKQLADNTELLQETGYQPRTTLREGLANMKQALSSL